MASQVYFVKADAVNLIKIGRSNDAERRFAELRLLSPVALTVMGVIPGGSEKESELHRRFRAIRSHGEWFFATRELVSFVNVETMKALWHQLSDADQRRFVQHLYDTGYLPEHDRHRQRIADATERGA